MRFELSGRQCRKHYEYRLYQSSKRDDSCDAILKIRQVGINKETIYTCYVTEKKKLIGVVDVKDILTSGESRKIEEIMDENVLYARTLDDQEMWQR